MRQALPAASSRHWRWTRLLPGPIWGWPASPGLCSTTARAAEDWLRQAEQAAPDAAYVQIQRAELCSAWEDMACAEQAYQAALTSRPNSGWLHGRAGDLYRPTNPVRAGQSWDKAAEQYTWAVEFRPQDPWAHERLAYVLLNQGHAADAVAHYTQAIKLAYADSAPARLYCSLALAQQHAGLAAESQASQAECTKRRPAARSPP